MNVKATFLVIFSMLSTVCDAVESMEFSYSYPQEIEWFGYKRAETYDVAIKVSNQSLVGSRISGIKVRAVGEYIDAETITAWISSELKLEKNAAGQKVNAPDLANVKATLRGDSVFAVFDNPISLPEEGVYIGYSFAVKEGAYDEMIPAVAVGPVAEEAIDCCWWLHASKSLVKWVDMGSQKELASKMTVTFTGDFHENAASLQLPEKIWNVSNQPNDIRACICNNGTAPIEKLEYTYEIDGSLSGQGEYIFREPLPAAFGYPVWITPEIEGFDFSGWHSAVVTVTKVNGVGNPDMAREAAAEIDFIPFKPECRPLVEEYTGLWCGWCPSGYVVMEQLYDEFPENFVGVSYHTRDVMTVWEENDLPSHYSSLPCMYIDRENEYDPLKFRRPWEKVLLDTPPAELTVALSTPGDSIIDVACVARFINDRDNADYKLSYILVADNLHSPEWLQANYYRGKTIEGFTGPYSDIFLSGDDHITDLRYDHVAIACSEDNDALSALPSTIMAGEAYEVSYQFDVSKVRNLNGATFFNQDTNFRVVAVLRDEGKIYTSSQSDALTFDDSYVPGLREPNRGIISSEIYSATGQKLATPQKGINILTTRYSDGSYHVKKLTR